MKDRCGPICYETTVPISSEALDIQESIQEPPQYDPVSPSPNRFAQYKQTLIVEGVEGSVILSYQYM